MGNISKKNRKKLAKVINANCHRVTIFGEQNAMFVPYDSSPCLLFGNISASEMTAFLQVIS